MYLVRWIMDGMDLNVRMIQTKTIRKSPHQTRRHFMRFGLWGVAKARLSVAHQFLNRAKFRNM